MNLSDEQIAAWLHDHLDSDEAARVAAQVAADPELTRRADRLRRRVNSLLAASSRLARKATDVEERQWAERLTDALKAFVAQEFAHTTPFDVQTLVEKK
jgi:hypothetical protein